MGYPVYLLVAVLITAVVLTVFVQSALFITQNSEEHMIYQELQKIVIEAQNMYEYADEGTMVTVHLELPSSLRFAVFGDVPLPGYKQPGSLDRNNAASNNQYYYVMNNGEMAMFHISARFCGDATTDIVFLQPGSFDITLELIRDLEGHSFVKIT